MRCFFHGDVEAVAVCKSCGRAICHDCSTEIGAAIGCRNRCESDVAALNTIVERSKTIYQRTGGIYRRNGWLFIIVAILFGALGFGIGDGHSPNIPLLVISGMFLIFAGFQFVNGRRFSEK